MFTNVRKALAALIAPKTIVINATQEQLSQARSVTAPLAPKHIVAQRAHDQQPMVGDFHVSHLDSLGSNYLKNAKEFCAARGFVEPLTLAVTLDGFVHGSFKFIASCP